MKMQNFISSSDLLCWNIVLKGTSAKSMTIDNDGNLKIRPSITAEEHQQVQREQKARTILLSALLDEHMGDFYHMIDARDIQNAIKARFGYDKMQKILTQMNTLKIKPDPEDINMKFLRGLPSSSSGYSLSSPTLSNAAFVSTAGSSQVNLSYQELINGGYGGYNTTLFASPDQQLAYEVLDQMNKDKFEEYDLKHQMAMLSIKQMGHFSRECRAQGVQNNNNYQKYKSKEAGKDGSDSKAMVVIDGSIDWDNQTEEGNPDPRSLENFGMLAGIKLESDAESEVVYADDIIPAAVFVSASPVVAAAISPHSEIEFALMGLSTEVSIPVTCPLCCDSKYKLIEKDYHEQRQQLNDCVVNLKAHKHAVKSLEKQIKCHQTNQLAYEEKIRVLLYELEEKSNILEYRQKLIDQAIQEKQDLMTKLDNELANQANWINSGKNLYKLIDNSMSVRTKRGLGLDKYIGEGELGIDDSVLSIFHTSSDDLEAHNRFALVGHMKVVPPPLTGNYMPPSNIPDIDESQMVYGTTTTDSSKIKTNDDSISHSHDTVLFYFSDSVSTPASESRDTIVIDCARQEDFPSVCTSSIETDVKSSETLYCDLHEQRLVKRNAEGKGKLGRRPTGKLVNPNIPNLVSVGQPYPFSAGQPNPVSTRQRNIIFAGQPYPVSTGQPNLVFAGQQNTVFAGSPNLVYAVSQTQFLLQIIFPITHNSLYSLYETGGLNGKTIVKPSAGWPWTKSSMSTTKGSKINGGSKSKIWSFAKGPLGRPKMEKAKDRGIVDSGCSRSMSGNKDKLEDFEQFNGGEVTFGGSTGNSLMMEKAKDRGIVDSGCSRSRSGNKDKLEDFEHFNGGEVTFGGSTCKISGKGTIKTKNLNFENVLYVKELQHFNLISVSQICDQTHRVLFTETECLVLFKDFPLLDPSMEIRSCQLQEHEKTGKGDSLGKFDTKSDEGYIVGYSISSKAYRVYNLVSRKIKETMNLIFLENKPFVARTGQAWMFDIDYLADSLNYSRVSSNNLTVGSLIEKPSNVGSQEDDSDSDDEPDVLVIYSTHTPEVPIVDEASIQNDGKEEADRLRLAFPSLNPILGVCSTSIGSFVSTGSTPPVSAGSTPPLSPCASPISADCHSISASQSPVPAARPPISAGRSTSAGRPSDSAGRPVFAGKPSGSAARTPVYVGRILGKVTKILSSDRFPRASSVETLDIHDDLTIFDCPKSGIFTSSSYDKDLSGPDANNLEISFDVTLKGSSESAFISYIHDQRKNNHLDLQLCMFSCFLSHEEPTTVAQALANPDWVEAMQAEMQQFRNQKVNKARLVAQGYRQEEGIDYTDVFSPVARLEAIRLFLAFASFIGFKVYQMDVKSSFLYGMITEEVYITQPRGFEDQIIQRKSTRLSKLCMAYIRLLKLVCAAARHQDTPKTSHLLSIKQIFKYLIAYPKLGLWYPRDSPFDLEAFSDSDYAGVHEDRKSTTGGCTMDSKSIARLWWLLVTFAGHVIFCWLIVIHAGDLVSVGRWSFLLVAVWLQFTSDGRVIFCWLLVVPAVVSLPDGVKGLVATIDGTTYTVTEAFIRSALQLDDLNAIDTLTNVEIFDRLRAIGYATEGKFTFFKIQFSPQWKFLIHIVIYCISSKSGSWNQFASNIAIALICLSTRRKYNFSNMIFHGMYHNVSSRTKFLMYPRFLQIILDTETEDTTPYPAPLVTKKFFANMRHYQGPDMPLLAHMLNQGEPALVQAQPQEVSPPMVEPHPSPDPIPSPPRQSSPPPIPFGPAPNFGIASTDLILNIPSSSRPSDLVLETITSPIRDDGTGGGSFHESLPSPPPTTLTRSPTLGVAEEPLTLTSLLALFPTCLQRIANLEAELKATKMLHRDAVVLFAKRIKKLESKLKSKKRKLETSPTTLDAVLTLSQSKARARAAMIIYRHIKKQQSSSGLDFTDAAIPAVGRVFAGGADPADVVVSASGADPADVVVSAGGADPADVVVSTGVAASASTFISAGVLVAAGLFVPSAPSSPIRDPAKGKARVAEEYERESRASAAQSTPRQAELDRIALNLTNEEWIGLVDQVWANPTLSAELLGADVSEDTFSVRMVKLMNQQRKAIVEIKAKAKRDKPLTLAQQKEYMCAFVKNQSTTIYTTGWTWEDVRGLTDDQLQNSGETLESSVAKRLKSSHSTEQSAELQETTSVSFGATNAAGDPVSAVPSVFAASSIPTKTPIAAGVSTTAGVSELAFVHIIDLLDSPPKATSLPLDPKTTEHVVPIRKSSRKKSMARRRTLPRPSQSESAALSFDEDDPKAEFKKYLRQVSDDDEPAELVSLSLVGRADLMVLYGMVSDKYKLERATGIGLGLWSGVQTLITAREDRDASIIWDDQDQREIQS
uniref:Uncharacterized protein n=1 Tax=Tanacetum cinerariifolium TaxID=118510 RepID=A0A6L2J626_TANCI|nr:hypothetical protein [Tanacetum cinerariifolium]